MKRAALGPWRAWDLSWSWRPSLNSTANLSRNARRFPANLPAATAPAVVGGGIDRRADGR